MTSSWRHSARHTFALGTMHKLNGLFGQEEEEEEEEEDEDDETRRLCLLCNRSQGCSGISDFV